MKYCKIIACILGGILMLTGCTTNQNDPTQTPGPTENIPGETTQSTKDALYEMFNSEDVALRPRPLFFWNTTLASMNEEEVRTIIRRCYEECGYGGFGVLPYWMEGYLTDRYFDLYEAMLDEGSKYGMQFSLYDENGFPSYTAGGYLAEQYPELTAKRLDKVEKKGSDGATITLSIPEGTYMGAVLMNTDTYERQDVSDKAVIQTNTGTGDMKPGYYSSSDFSGDYVAKFGFDENTNTRWNAADGTSGDQWLMEIFDKEVTIDKVTISEAFDRIRSFDIQYWDGTKWVNCASGTTVGANKTVTFDAVKTTRIRLYVNRISSDSVSIWEFAAYHGNQKIKPNMSSAIKQGNYIECTVPEGNWKLMAFVCVKDGTKGMDYLSKEAVRAYIDITYEAYYQRFEKYFGTTITTAFYDESCFWNSNENYGVAGARFWTPNFNDDFARIYGKDVNPILYYPALFEDIGEATAEARDRLQYVRTTLFAENYIGQIDQWCKEHSIQLTGHMNEEQSKNPVGIHGDLMRVFQHQAIPGIDLIWHYGQAQNAYKIVSSSAYNWDKQLVMVEAFGAIDNATPETLFKGTMDLYAKGINFMVPHAVWYDMNNVVFKPELSYRNPQFASKLPAFSEYVSRLNAVLQQGRHVADIAVLYPIDYLESEFLFNGTYNEPGRANYMEVGEYLSLTARHDFTYLHPDVLDGNCTVENGVLKLNNKNNYENYKVVVMTGSEVISLKNLQKIYDFWKSGGSVIVVGTLPSKGITVSENAAVVALIEEMFAEEVTVNAAGGKAITIRKAKQLEEALKQAADSYDVQISGVPEKLSDGNFSYIHKVVKDCDVWFFANSSATEFTAEITLDGEYSSLELWNPATGEKSTLESQVENGKTIITLEIGEVSSLFVVAG